MDKEKESKQREKHVGTAEDVSRKWEGLTPIHYFLSAVSEFIPPLRLLLLRMAFFSDEIYHVSNGKAETARRTKGRSQERREQSGRGRGRGRGEDKKTGQESFSYQVHCRKKNLTERRSKTFILSKKVGKKSAANTLIYPSTTTGDNEIKKSINLTNESETCSERQNHQ